MRIVHPAIFVIASKQVVRRSWSSLVWMVLLLTLVRVSFSQTSVSGQGGESGAIALRVIVVSSEAEAQQILERITEY